MCLICVLFTTNTMTRMKSLIEHKEEYNSELKTRKKTNKKKSYKHIFFGCINKNGQHYTHYCSDKQIKLIVQNMCKSVCVCE